MLILTRLPDERIFLGDHIVVTVLSVSGQAVRLGFTAPDDVDIVREEVSRRVRHPRTSREARP